MVFGYLYCNSAHPRADRTLCRVLSSGTNDSQRLIETEDGLKFHASDGCIKAFDSDMRQVFKSIRRYRKKNNVNLFRGHPFKSTNDSMTILLRKWGFT